MLKLFRVVWGFWGFTGFWVYETGVILLQMVSVKGAPAKLLVSVYIGCPFGDTRNGKQTLPGLSSFQIKTWIFSSFKGINRGGSPPPQELLKFSLETISEICFYPSLPPDIFSNKGSLPPRVMSESPIQRQKRLSNIHPQRHPANIGLSLSDLE